MSASKQFAWVTFVSTEEESDAAAALGLSLQKTGSIGRKIVIVDPGITTGRKRGLQECFDLVIPLNGNPWDGLKGIVDFRVLVKIFALGLYFLDQCIFLEPMCLAVGNPDELWETLEQKKNKSGKESPGSFALSNGYQLLAKPSNTLYQQALKYFGTQIKEIEAGNLENVNGNFLKYFAKLSEENNFVLLQSPSFVSTCPTSETMSKTDSKIRDSYPNEQLNEVLDENTKTKEPIAVVGMACRLPSCKNIFEFWNLLENEGDAIRTPPEHRWNKEQYPFRPMNFEKTQAGFLSMPIDEFDANFFGISPKDAVSMDPQYRLLLEVVWESLENAGINPEILKGALGGVFLGTWQNDYKEILQLDKSSDIYRIYKGNCVGSGSAAISHSLGWTGPSVGIESDCAAGLSTVYMACDSLRNKKCEIALACGVNILIKPFTLDSFPPVLSSDFRCKAFDNSANGYVRAEGCVSFVLKRYSDAVKDGDRIWALIRGSSVNHDGLSSSVGTPTAISQTKVLREALKDGGVNPCQVSYVEAHGTGTAVGDPVEMEAIREVYGLSRNIKTDGYLIIGSVKTNVGHTESCSGLTGMLKVILSMWKEVIPTHINFKQLNSKIDLEAMKARLPVKHIKWSKAPSGKPRMAAVSAFGISGKNSHVILEESPYHLGRLDSTVASLERPLHILKITAKSELALETLIEKFQAILKESAYQENKKLNFGDFTYTANAGRADFNWRTVIIADDFKSAHELLRNGSFEKFNVTKVKKQHRDGKICFLFTGQGSQYHGMAQQLYEFSPVFRLYFDYCNGWIESTYGISIKKTLFSSKEEDKIKINESLFSQIGIFIVEYCLMKLWQSWGVKPSFVLGHSLGEFCAAVCTGILDIEDAMRLVVERSKLIQGLPGGKMLVIKANHTTVEKLQMEFFSNTLEEKLDYAAFNSEDQTVVAGCPKTIKEFQSFLKQKKGIKCTLLNSSHAFHSKDMDPILEEYKKVAQTISYKKPSKNVRFISGMLGRVLQEGCKLKVDAEYWVQHTRDAVWFCKASKLVTEELGCLVFLELGPNPVLSALVAMNNLDTTGTNKVLCLPSLRKNTNEWKTMLTSLGKLYTEQGVAVDWQGLKDGYKRTNVGHILPSYPFERTAFWPSIPIELRREDGSHPLLGQRLANPTSAVIFQSKFSSLTKTLQYLKDHMIGHLILLPAAAFIEMFLAFGMQNFGFKNLIPIKIKDIKIVLPLQLEQTSNQDEVLCQTVTEAKNDESEESVKCAIYHSAKHINSDEYSTLNDTIWSKHASATIELNQELNVFCIKSDTTSDDTKLLQNIFQYKDKQTNKEMLNSLKRLKGEENLTDLFYRRYLKAGLNLKGAFQTLTKIWRCDKTRQFLAEVNVPTGNDQKYNLHPILIDAMIQTAIYSGPLFDSLMGNEKQEPKLFVPVGCRHFVLMKPLITSRCFIYTPNADLHLVLLFDDDGHLVSYLNNIEFAETTVERIHEILQPKMKPIPNFYSIEWKVKSKQDKINFDVCQDGPDISKKYWAPRNNIAQITDYDNTRTQYINKLVSCYITKALLCLGWDPKIGKLFQTNQLMRSLGIRELNEKAFHHFLGFLEQDGFLNYLNKKSHDAFVITSIFPNSVENLDSMIEMVLEQLAQLPCDENIADISLLQVVGAQLNKIFIGEEPALGLLYPIDSSSIISAALYYEKLTERIMPTFQQNIKEHWENLKLHYARIGTEMPKLRILEIGAGTGLAASVFLESLEQADISFEYVYTDISPAFFASAEKKLKKYQGSIKFKKLDIEDDPTSQGFPPKYFDVVLAFHVIHATKDIRESLSHIRTLMADWGNLWMSETIDQDRLMDCTFGLLDGFWRFTDTNLRPRHCMLSSKNWERVTKETGFSQFHCLKEDSVGLIVCRAHKQETFSLISTHDSQNHYRRLNVMPNSRKWITLYGNDTEAEASQLVNCFHTVVGKKCKKVNYSDIHRCCSELLKESNEFGKSDSDRVEGIIIAWGLSQAEKNQDNISKPFLILLQTLIKLPPAEMPECILLTRGQYSVGDTICSNPSASTLIGMATTAVNECKDLKLRIIDLDPTTEPPIAMWKAFQEIFNRLDDFLPYISVFRKDYKFIPQFTMAPVASQTLSLPLESNAFQIKLSPSRRIQDLRFEGLNLDMEKHLRSNEILVETVCCGLNFRDVFTVLKPTPEFSRANQIGVDFSGIVINVGPSVKKWKIGDKIYGINSNWGPLQSHFNLSEDVVAKLPNSVSFMEAACIPVGFQTAYYSLVELAHGKKGETILIHSGSGAVGLFAIQIAKQLGMQVICTAGSERKRSYLKCLGIPYVFNSRNTEYSKQILQVTDGKGVDIVLNSITGPGFKEASLAACGKQGRFIELSVINIWTDEEINALRSDVVYLPVEPNNFISILKQGRLIPIMSDWILNGKISCIPFTRFDAVDIRDALVYLQKAKHIGKVICAMPRVQYYLDKYAVKEELRIPLFNEKSTYLITGGLGGIGLEVCKYMTAQGAQYIVLNGRSPPSQDVLKILDLLEKTYKCSIRIILGDVGEQKDCKRIFETIKQTLPPLRGIMHAAGTLSDSLLKNLSWSDFEKTFQSKIKGSWNLHELTKQLNLEHFVLFSSIASQISCLGQATHVSACTFEDTFAHFRNSQGLTATSINWGQWGEVGVASALEVKQLRPFLPSEAINALDRILRKNETGITVAKLNENLGSFIYMYQYTNWITDKGILNQPDSNNVQGNNSKGDFSSETFWRLYDECHGESQDVDRDKLANIYLERMLKTILCIESNKGINKNQDLSLVGMDSLMILELVNMIQTVCGERAKISQASIRDCKTLQSLAIRLVEVIEGKWNATPAPSIDEVKELSLLDARLPEVIQQDNPGSQVASPSLIKYLLITGATGFVGSQMLKELLEHHRKLEKVYCLVRGEKPFDRLVLALEKNCIKLSQRHLDKLEVLSGDFTQHNFGLLEADHARLSKKIDAICHMGAFVHHGEYYRKVPGSFKDIRSVNVLGMLNILKFACKNKTKYVFHGSSIITAWDRNSKDGSLSESWPSINRLSLLETNMGYPISKMINELHLKRAMEDIGIPVKVFRFPDLRASTTSGKSFISGSHLMKVSIFFFKEGIVPSNPFFLSVIPVDVAAKIATELIFNDKAPIGIYNVTHPEPVLLREVIPELGHQFGFHVSTFLDFHEIADRIVNRCKLAKKEFDKEGKTSSLKKAIVYELEEIYLDKDLYKFFLNFANYSYDGMENCKEYWVSRKLQQYVPKLYSEIESPLQILKRDLYAAVNEGLLDLL